jgi:hypothetical protein
VLEGGGGIPVLAGRHRQDEEALGLARKRSQTPSPKEVSHRESHY